MRELKLVRSAVAQANTGQTDYVDVPSYARHATFYLNVQAAAGTTPLTDFVLRRAAPKMTGAVVVATPSAGGTAENEIQTIDLGDFGAGDSTDFTFGGVETTNALAFNTLDAGADAAAREAIVQAVLEDIPALAGNISVTEDTENLVYDVEFINDLAETDVGAITITSASGFTATGVTETNKGVGHEIQTVTLTGGPTHGTWKISWTGVSANISATTREIPATATAAEVSDAIIDALGSDGSYTYGTYNGQDIDVSRSGAGTSGSPYVYTLTFSGPTVAYTDVDAVTVDGTKLYTYADDSSFGLGNGWNGITQIAGTTSGSVCVELGPDLIETEDDTGAIYRVQTVLPNRIAAVTTLDRTSGNETYTYSVYVEFSG